VLLLLFSPLPQSPINSTLKLYSILRLPKTISSIEQRMKGYEQVLRCGLGLFTSSEHVSRLEFHNYISNLQVDKYWPGIQGIGYAVILKPEEKDVFVNTVRLEGYNQFNIFPPGLRDQYSIILYIEPFTARNQRAFGYI
jgi:CHASE1-domain containing sensor protein